MPAQPDFDFTDPALLDRIRRELWRISKDGKMPSIRKWNRLKAPDLPSAQYIVEASPRFATYSDLAEWAGLRANTVPRATSFPDRALENEVVRLAGMAADPRDWGPDGLNCIERKREVYEYERNGQPWRLTRTWYAVR